MRLATACLLLVAGARAFTVVPAARTTRLRAPVPSVARRTTILRAEAEEANVGTAVRNIAPWLLFVLVEPALRIPNYKECVAEKGHEACANLLPSRAVSSEKVPSSRRWFRVDRLRVDGATPRRFFQWLYEHGIDVAAI